MKEDIDEQVKEESDRIEDEDVRNMGNVVSSEDFHLLFSGGHEEEARGIEKLVM